MRTKMRIAYLVPETPTGASETWPWGADGGVREGGGVANSNFGGQVDRAVRGARSVLAKPYLSMYTSLLVITNRPFAGICEHTHVPTHITCAARMVGVYTLPLQQKTQRRTGTGGNEVVSDPSRPAAKKSRSLSLRGRRFRPALKS